ncbi:MAG TPA: ATP-binding cassette domain-containing protein [Ktedonobacterales bacterium]
MTDRVTERATNRATEPAMERPLERGAGRATEGAIAPMTTPLPPRAPEPIIVARGLGYTYQSGPLRKDALVDVDLEIARGTCAAIIGVTGSGKSTLVRHFNGLLRPTSGSVTVDGVETRGDAADLPALRRRVGMLFQFPEAQLFARTVYADVAFGPQRLRLPRREVRVRVHDALAMVGLAPEEFGARSPFDLSGGQRRRVALAGVLAMAPTVLILDEPAVGLDAEGRADMYAILRRVRVERDATIILVSHDMAEVAALADTVAVLRDGRLVMHGSPRAIFARAEELEACGLAPPPLAELLALLRARGLDVPSDALTLDEAFAAIVQAMRN